MRVRAAANTAAARAFVDGLARAGVRHACVTPGSRSTPLTVALAEQSAIRPWLHLDERASAFFALGLARASGGPVALVCTSGTAAVNFHPAVVEADLSRTPLVLCTADRPTRLRNVGAAQTIWQPGLYGVSARLARDLPAPGEDGAPPALFAVAAREAVAAALGPLPGPSHLNLPFEEPLIGAPPEHPAPETSADGPAGPPPVAPPLAPHAEALAAAADALARAERPLIVAGPESGGLPAGALAELARALGAPLLADPLSGLRTGAHDRSRVIDAYDALLRDARAAPPRPDCVLRFGAAPTSRALNGFLAACGDASHALCDLPGSFRDPNGVTTHRLTADARSAAEALRGAVTRAPAPEGWLAAWRQRDARARRALREFALAAEEPFEGRAVVELQRALPAGATLFAGNSMPVRDADSFLAGGAKPLEVAANRGANGIDGVVSTALGHAAAGRGATALLIGDLSLAHDLNGLWAGTRHGLDLAIVLVNNNGGGIFHYLPQAAHEHVFEEWFGTPGGVDFAAAAHAFGAGHRLLGDWAELDAALAAGGVRVLEFRTDRARNRELHERAWRAAADAARSAGA